MIDSAMKRRIDTLTQNRDLPDADLVVLLEHLDRESAEYLYEAARKVRHEIYGHEVYLRGSLSSPMSAKMIAITAASAEATRMPSGIG